MDIINIYKQYGDKIYRVCLGFVNDSDKAKDLTQETFITVWQNLKSFRNESAISTWIYRIATNKCLKLIQKEKKQAEFNNSFLPKENSIDEIQEEEKIYFLKKYISELQEVDRLIITLFMEEIPQEKIAEIMGLTHTNIRVKIHRIKDKLLKKFKGNGKF